MLKTQTHLYYRVDLGKLHSNMEMMEEQGWSVRLFEILKHLHEIKKVMEADTLPVQIQVLTVLVVYEREHE